MSCLLIVLNFVEIIYLYETILGLSVYKHFFLLFSAELSAPLSEEAEVIFLLDSSENVRQYEFEKQREFVRELAKRFAISPNGPHAAVASYNTTIIPIVKRESYQSLDEFNKLLNAAINRGKM